MGLQPPEQPPKEYRELPVANLAPQHKRSPLLRVLLVVGIVIVVAVVVAVLVIKPFKRPPAKPVIISKAKVTTPTLHIDSTTKRFDSTDLYLGFAYPADWTVDDPGSGILKAVSPPLSIKTTGGKTTAMRIVMTIQNATTSVPAFAANSAVAPIASQKLTYTQPTPGQRAQTYLTAVNYNDGYSTIDALYITGDNGYTEAQYVPQTDVSKANPLISLSFYACDDAACTKYTTATSVATSAWASQDLSKPLVAMLESLQID